MFGDGGLTQFAGWIERKKGDRSAAVLGGEQELSTGMNRDVAAAAVWAGHPGEFLELTLVDVITDSPGPSLPAAHRIQNLTVWVQGQETGRANLGCQFNGGELPVVGVKSGMINAFCPGAARSEKDVYGLGQAQGEK